MPFDRDFNQYQQKKGSKGRFGKWIGAILLIFLLLFMMNHLVKKSVTELIEKQQQTDVMKETIPDNLQ